MAGQIVHGKKDSYRVEKTLSERLKTNVYSAISLNQGLDVVLKKGNIEMIKGLEREAAIQILIQKAGGHKNILPSYEIIKDEKIVAVPRIRTGTLEDLQEKIGIFTEKEVIPLVLNLCDGVDYLHSLGIVHRDVKRDNVLLELADPNLQKITRDTLIYNPELIIPKLYDFDVSLHDCISGYDKKGCVYGTPTAMAPESIIAGGKVDLRSDIYGLGILMYELLADNSPFRTQSAYETMLNQIKEFAPLLSNVSPAFNYVLLRALEKNPDQRYQNVGELKQDLEMIQNGL